MPVAEKPVTPCLVVGEGEAKKELKQTILELEIEEHHELASVFRTKLAIVREEDGLWTFLDQGTAKPWQKVEVKLDVGDREELLIVGYVTQVRAHIDATEGSSFLELVGMDTSALMSVEEVIKDWPGKRDSEIAIEIFDKYGLDYEVEDTEVVHEEQASTVIQRESDIQFLKRLARRNGFECVMQDKTAVFVKPDLKKKALPVLAAHFGKETTLTSFDASWNALRPTAVEMHQIDTGTKEVQSKTLEKSGQTLLGKDAPVAPPSPATARTAVRHQVTTGLPEAERLIAAIAEDSEWFIEAKGEVDCALYGDILRARRRVPIKGVGELFSGMYYLTSVTHKYSVERYTQQFTARRNASTALPDDFPAASLI